MGWAGMTGLFVGEDNEPAAVADSNAVDSGSLTIVAVPRGTPCGHTAYIRTQSPSASGENTARPSGFMSGAAAFPAGYCLADLTSVPCRRTNTATGSVLAAWLRLSPFR